MCVTIFASLRVFRSTAASRTKAIIYSLHLTVLFLFLRLFFCGASFLLSHPLSNDTSTSSLFLPVISLHSIKVSIRLLKIEEHIEGDQFFLSFLPKSFNISIFAPPLCVLVLLVDLGANEFLFARGPLSLRFIHIFRRSYHFWFGSSKANLRESNLRVQVRSWKHVLENTYPYQGALEWTNGGDKLENRLSQAPREY